MKFLGFLTRLSSPSRAGGAAAGAGVGVVGVLAAEPWGRVRGETSGGCTLLRILEQRRRHCVSSRSPRVCRCAVRAHTIRSSSWGRCSVWISMYVSWR